LPNNKPFDLKTTRKELICLVLEKLNIEYLTIVINYLLFGAQVADLRQMGRLAPNGKKALSLTRILIWTK
jgi:hypothetical protein